MMLKLVKRKSGLYNVKNEKNKILLPEDYDRIDIQKYGIVARKNIKDTFLDEKFDIYNTDSNFLFSVINKYDGNYVTDIDFVIHENYIEELSENTPDYDRWDHDSSSTILYRHLDGSYFNLPFRYNNYEIGVVNNNICIIDNSNERYIYDIKNKKILFDYKSLTKPLSKMLNEINDILNNKIKNMVIKAIINYAKTCEKKYNLTKVQILNIRKELSEKLKKYQKSESTYYVMELNGYTDNKYYIKDQEIEHKMDIIKFIDDINWFMAGTIPLLNVHSSCELDDDKSKIYVKVFKDTISSNFETEKKKIEYNDDSMENEYGKYKQIVIVNILNDGLNLKINKYNLMLLRNIYKNITGKDFDIDSYYNRFNKNFILDKKIENDSIEYLEIL